jgi:hypothetical protein
MRKNSFFKRVAFLALLAVISAAGAYAQITISGGFAVSTVNAELDIPGLSVEGGIGLGGNIYLDYLLPIGVPLSLGAEIGVDTASLNFDTSAFPNGGKSSDSVMAIPILLRAAYHLDLFPKLDLYLVGKIGYTIGFITDGPDKENFDNSGGIAFGFDIGVAYYFASAFGVFIEGGFDDYALQSKFSEGEYSETISTPFYRFVTFGVSFKK